MLSIFDQARRDQTSGSSGSVLLGDAVRSLLRQWFFRPELHVSETSAPECADGVPLFLVLEDDARLSPDRWIGGMTLSLLSFAAASLMIGHGGKYPVKSIGSGDKSPFSAQVQSDASKAVFNTPVSVNPELADREIVARYFHAMPVLEALDLNHDLILSEDEIASAPEALRSLDRNGDGALNAAECRPNFTQSIKRMPNGEEFMTSNPVLATLDADHDGVISAKEIRNARVTLQRLDKNQDGRLTGKELLPEQMLHAVPIDSERN
jgi:hypothetical protein